MSVKEGNDSQLVLLEFQPPNGAIKFIFKKYFFLIKFLIKFSGNYCLFSKFIFQVRLF